MSILSFAQSHGLLVQPTAATAAGAGGAGGQASPDVAWIGVTPLVDTAAAIGDTVHLTARVADQRGGTVLAPIAWSSDSSEVATVSPDGAVVARAPGTVTIFAAAGAKIARARVTVRQRVVGARIVADSGLRLVVGARRRLRGQGLDARGHVVDRRPVVWSVADTTVARIDSAGEATGLGPGRTAVTATLENVSVRGELEVVDVPASFAVVNSAAQTALAGQAVSRPIEVEVLSASGRPVAEVAVHFGADGGDGRAEPATVQTDARGRARARWTLGDTPGRQRLPIAVDGLIAPVIMFAEAEPVAANLRSAALTDSASGRAGEEIAGEVGLRLTDSLGRALPGVPVSWTARDGGSAVAVEPRTDSVGESHVRWTLGPKTGRQRAVASIGSGRSIPRVTIAAVAVPGVPATTLVIGGGGQSGTVGAPLSRPIALRVADRNGNGIPGVAVTLLPAHGSVADSALTTDSTGTVRAAWTLGRAAGPQRLLAKVAGLPAPLALAARARPLGPTNLAFPDSAPDGQAGRTLPTAVSVTDAYGNPVPDALVTFRAGTGSVTPARVMTDAEGRASTRWRFGTTVGEQRLTASVKGSDTRAVLTVPVAAAPSYAASSGNGKAAKSTKHGSSPSQNSRGKSSRHPR